MTDTLSQKFPSSVLIYNPKSGSAVDRDIWLGSVIDKLCTSLQHSVTVRATTPGISASEIMDDSPSALPDLVIAAGGDGTIRHILGWVADKSTDMPVGVIPFGTGNQLARNLKILEENIFQDPIQHAVDVITTGKKKLIDLGKVNGNYFCVAVGVGPGSDAILAPSQEDKVNWGILAYVGPMLQTVASPAVPFRITADGERFDVKALAVIVSNVGDMGFARLSGDAQLDDGYLDLCIITAGEFGDYVKLGFNLATSMLLGDTPFYMRRVKDVSIESLNGPVVANVDGDAIGYTPLNISVVPKAVNVLWPG
jgi:diacylglycerol kinase (ATP)